MSIPEINDHLPATAIALLQALDRIFYGLERGFIIRTVTDVMILLPSETFRSAVDILKAIISFLTELRNVRVNGLFFLF